LKSAAAAASDGITRPPCGDDSVVCEHRHRYEAPDFVHFFQLTAALLLCTAAAVLSAWDAEWQCVRHETYALLDLVDDDNFQKAYESAVEQEEDKCINMFERIVVPASAATAGCSLLVLLALWIYLHRQRRTGVVASTRSMMRMTVLLLVVYAVILALQTWTVTAVMLTPRHVEATENPYQSLAAVDRYGRVGDNANLYYLTWTNQGLAIALTYQTVTACFRLLASRREGRPIQPTPVGDLLPSTSWDMHEDSVLKSSSARAAWYSSLYRLRVRTGIWTATAVSSWVIVASSQYLWKNRILRKLEQLQDNEETADDYYEEDTSETNPALSFLSVCPALAEYGKNGEGPLCRRTLIAWFSGVAAAVLCLTAITIHFLAKYGRRHNSEFFSSRDFSTKKLPLRTELCLSIVLSAVLGFNAVWVTGVQGPAATVGNLYYASWLSFLLTVRICLGCVEEVYNIEEDDRDELEDLSDATTTEGGDGDPHSASVDGSSYRAPSMTTTVKAGSPTRSPVRRKSSLRTETSQSSMDTHAREKQEKTRVGRVRNYFFLGIFSTVCAASSYDAASNQGKAPTRVQMYLMLAPCFVALLSTLLFFLCLSKRCFKSISKCAIGGILSIASFGLWLGELLLTMHSEDSWAVNGIGEIEMANLYYYSWAAIITSGLQMTSYVKSFLGWKMNDFMSVVWVAIIKVCFVILGAALHIWHTIADNCEFDEITTGAVTFCSRTILAMTVALTGMVVGGLVVTVRLLVMMCPVCRCRRLQAHVEMLVSLFLVLLFGAAVALITGIGGPGQSVGDLYYSTWLAFWVSLGIFVNCYQQLNNEEDGIEEQRKQPEQRVVENVSPSRATDYVLV
jgi:hypothetical protein